MNTLTCIHICDKLFSYNGFARYIKQLKGNDDTTHNISNKIIIMGRLYYANIVIMHNKLSTMCK